MSGSPAGGAYLSAYLRLLEPWLSRPDVTDIFVNAPGEVWIEALGGSVERRPAPVLTEVSLARLAQQIARVTHQGLSRESPLISATLPSGARVQVVGPPATRGPLALAVRKHVATDVSVDDYLAAGSVDRAVGADGDVDAALEAQLRAGDVSGFLREAVRTRKNVIISGGTSSGKTTFLNSLLRSAPTDQRIVAIEDAPEIRIDHPNAVGLVAVRGRLGEAQVSVGDLLEAALRMRPDRIVLGELRGPEAYSFLRAVNTGHPGSLTTVHADSPRGALDQIALMVLQARANLSRGEIVDYVQRVVDVFVQLTRVDGQRRVTQVVFRGHRIDLAGAVSA